MLNKFRTLAMMVVLITMFSVKDASAVFMWDWMFTNDGITVGNTETVYQQARIFNNSTAGETLAAFTDSTGTAYVSSAFAQGVGSFYAKSFGPDFFSQFDAPLLPGEYRDFLFIPYIPRDGNIIPDGNYVAQQGLSLALTADNTPVDGVETEYRCYNWNVGSGTTDSCPDSPNIFSEGGTSGGNSAVPEPATMLLLGSGLVGVALRKRKV